jgi:hypothetical protein
MQEMVGFGPEIGFLLDEKALHEVSPTLLRVGAGGQGETIHGGWRGKIPCKGANAAEPRAKVQKWS